MNRQGGNYGVSALDYLGRALALAESDQLEDLFHAALELRCALERTPFDYLVLMTGGDSNEVLKHPGKYKPRDVFALARALDSEIEDRIRFGSLLLRSENLISEEESFDPKWLAEAHSECDQYLHAQKDPVTTVDDSAWVEDLRLFLRKTAEKLLAMWKANQAIPVKLTRSGSDPWKRSNHANTTTSR